MTVEAPEASKKTDICPQCRGKGFVLCPKCQGTGDIRNVFFQATGSCPCCQPIMPKMMKGFVACQKCHGEGTLGPAPSFQAERGLRPITRSSMNLWTFPDN